MRKPTLAIVAALNCEVKHLVDYYRLKKTIAAPFDYYQSADAEVELIVTGIGALSVATAIGWLAAHNGDAQRVWLNVGTAGHASRALGEILLVHGCADSFNQRSHYPPLVAKWSGATDALLSLYAPSSDYSCGAAIDMEAHAFYSAALKFSSAELVQSVKVISDNEISGIEKLNATVIAELMQPHTETITAFAQKLLALAPRRFDSPSLVALNDLIKPLRATHSQRLQLAELLQKVVVLDVDVYSGLERCGDMKETLAYLREQVGLATPDINTTEPLC